MTRPKISIITICLNQEDFIAQCITSVLEQDCQSVEYIVVDAGSTDNSRALISQYGDRIARVIFEPDEGPADGLNKGFSKATGEIFGFLNADDVLLPGALDSVVQWFDANPETDVLSGHCWILDEEGNTVRRFFSDRFSLRMAAYGASILVQPSTFFRAELFRKCGGFNTANHCAWDGELFVDMALAGARFSLVNQVWSGFRLHGESITATGKMEDLRKSYNERIFEKIIRRPIGRWDRFVGQAMRYIRKLRNPRDTLERVRYGPIFKARAKQS